MNGTFREYIELLRANDELLEIRKPVDLRDVAALTDQSDKAVLFENPVGYSMPVACGLLQKREQQQDAVNVPLQILENKRKGKAVIDRNLGRPFFDEADFPGENVEHDDEDQHENDPADRLTDRSRGPVQYPGQF